MPVKTCGKCGETKPLDQFHARTGAGDGYQYRCASCTRVDANARTLERREWLASLKSIPCMDCGVQHHPAVMQWDHRPGTVKLLNMGKQAPYVSKERVLAEIAKCDVVCANCHTYRTWTRTGLIPENYPRPRG